MVIKDNETLKATAYGLVMLLLFSRYTLECPLSFTEDSADTETVAFDMYSLLTTARFSADL